MLAQTSLTTHFSCWFMVYLQSLLILQCRGVGLGCYLGGKGMAGDTLAERPKRASKRVSPRLVALSSAAILTIYAAGYARTNSAAHAAVAPVTPVAAVTQPTFVASAANDVPPTSTALPSTSIAAVAPPATSATANAAPTATTSATTGLRDGTYSGLGSSRHGDIGVSVVVQGGRVVSAEVTQCMTRYPCSVIASLPGQVVAAQRPPVNFVSGATDSSQAYTEAVTAALAQAR
jgi:uncharacterized protein with FMN-binding domain